MLENTGLRWEGCQERPADVVKHATLRSRGARVCAPRRAIDKKLWEATQEIWGSPAAKIRQRRSATYLYDGSHSTLEISLNSRHNFTQVSPPSSLRYR